MKFAIVTLEWMIKRGLFPTKEQRKNKQGTEIIIHEEELILYAEQEGFKSYDYGSEELKNILESEDWTWSEDETVDTNFNMLIAIQNLLVVTKEKMSTYNLTTNEQLILKEMYPYWVDFKDKPLKADTIVNYSNKLYKVKKDISVVLENEYPSITEELYELITSEEVSK